MFLSTSVLNNLMKKAYKTGLVVARTQDAQGNDWLYLAGSYWEVSVNKDFIPKEKNREKMCKEYHLWKLQINRSVMQ